MKSVRWLYEGLGRRVNRREELFETRAALLAGQRVWFELRSRPAFAPGASAGKQEAPSRKDR